MTIDLKVNGSGSVEGLILCSGETLAFFVCTTKTLHFVFSQSDLSRCEWNNW